MQATLRTLLVTAVLFAMLISPVLGKNVNTKHAEADFDSWTTWQFIENPARQATLEAAGRQETAAMVRQAVTDRLIAQGYVLAEEGATPDFQVGIEGEMHEVFDVRDIHKQVNEHVAFVLEGGTSSYREGTLLIRILDADSGDVVWTGWVTEKVKDAKDPKKQIDKVVRRILKRFPPEQD